MTIAPSHAIKRAVGAPPDFTGNKGLAALSARDLARLCARYQRIKRDPTISAALRAYCAAAVSELRTERLQRRSRKVDA